MTNDELVTHIPTPRLRYIDYGPSGDYSFHRESRRLQQWWSRIDRNGTEGEWRDVPVEHA